MKDKTWSELLSEAQNIVGSYFPNEYYWEYMKSEISYWGSIPRWLQEDYRSGIDGLDIGCAYGTLLAYLHSLGYSTLYAIDQQRYLSPSLEHFLCARTMFAYSPSLNIEVNPPYEPGQFDTIVMTEVLEHFNFYPTPTLIKIREMLAERGRLRKGRLYLSTPNQEYWGPQHKYYKSLRDIPLPDPTKPFVDGHIWHYSKLELLTVLQEAGLKVIRFEEGRHFAVTAEAA